ncbi:MAG TPA: HepT-like ribonuclease domain-containing protein [Phycisphaerales bacterium]|nr:HepT-like ribonuclease domain-containing protein [Phycisphaerales bacterium]
MLQSTIDIAEYLNGRTRDDLESDSMFRRAVINALHEIGEAAVRMSDEGRQQLPGIPWELVFRMRNVLVHVYWGIDFDRVWKAAIEDAPVLRAAIESFIRSTGEDQIPGGSQ